MNTEIVERLEESLDGRMPSSQTLGQINDLEGRLAIVSAISNARLETIEAFIRMLAPTEEARQEIWNAIRAGDLQVSGSQTKEK